jgi:hypothetical protein
MRTALSTELLLRLMNATPKQYAAVEQILGVSAKDRTHGTDGTDEECATPHPALSPDEAERVTAPTISEEVARSAFALLVRLDAAGKFKAPSPLTVFRLYCVDGYSADMVARKCRCAKGTVMARLRFIEQQTKTKPEDFRAMSGHLQQIDDDLRASGAREIYRRGLASENEEE